MDAPPPDPYKALGLTKDADATTIKATYRKLVLKCHPDKVEGKQDEFHKIQQAYELIGDDESRRKYDLEEQLLALKREKARNGPSVNVKAERYDVRTAAPAGSRNYEERKTSRSFEDDRHYEERARKFDNYDPYPKDSRSRSSRTEKEIPIRVTRVSSDRSRSDQKKTRDREERRDRSGKFAHIDEEFSSNDEKARYETDYRRRSDDARRMKDAEEAKMAAAEARQKAEDRRSYEDPRYDRQRKLSDQESEAMRHMRSNKTEVPDLRPSPSRTTSTRDVRPETYDRSSRREVRPEPVRRSSARPKETRTSSSSGRDRDRKGGLPEIVDWGEEDRSERKMPSFKHSSSSPADLHVPARAAPQRSYTEAPPREQRRKDSSPTPAFRRSETMPVSHSSSSRRKEATPIRPSLLRSSETLSHEPRTHSPESAYPTIPPPQSGSSKKYYYPTQAGGVRLSPEDVGVANGHRVVAHEPTSSRHRVRSPSPLSRPPMGPNRQSETSSQYQASGPKLVVPPPPLGRSATMNTSSPRAEERGRPRPALYGEIPKRENARRPSYSPDSVAYSRKILPDDIRWSNSRQPEKDREYAKPALSRHATYVY
jgi:curved DNA-binding protein CbpA